MNNFDLKDVWRDRVGSVARAMRPGAGFAFTYAGRIVGPEFGSEWWVTIEQGTSRGGDGRAVLSHPSGLKVTHERRVFWEFAAVEYTLQFKNTAQATLPALSAIHALHMLFEESALDGSCVVSSTGGLRDTLMPPQGLAVRKHHFSSAAHVQLLLDLMTKGGRSSNQDLPFLIRP